VINRRQFVVDKTETMVTSSGYNLMWSQEFGATPDFLAMMQSFNGDNPSNVRRDQLTGTMAAIHIDEEASLDSEVVHYGEVVGYAVFSP
jgi:hypothetical protein